MLVSKQLCSVNVDKGVNLQNKIHKQKHTHTHTKYNKNPPQKTTNKNNNKKTTAKQQTSKNKENII